MTRQCGRCTETFVYVNGFDGQGRKWKGGTCPQCRYGSMKNELKIKLGKRKCKGCNTNLPVSRWFYHETCTPDTYGVDPQISFYM